MHQKRSRILCGSFSQLSALNPQPDHSMIRIIGFDADDTLWHNENIFERAHEGYRRLLARHHPAAEVDRVLFATEMRNLPLYGYGIKGFTLSSVEAAIE